MNGVSLRFVVLGLALCTGACSSIVDGTSQEIQVNTDPTGAKCTFTREGTVIGTIESTPDKLKVQKTKDDISIACVKDGYVAAEYLNPSGAAAATFGNIILGGGIGWAIDSATGADNKYTSPVTIKMAPAVSAINW